MAAQCFRRKAHIAGLAQVNDTGIGNHERSAEYGSRYINLQSLVSDFVISALTLSLSRLPSHEFSPSTSVPARYREQFGSRQDVRAGCPA